MKQRPTRLERPLHPIERHILWERRDVFRMAGLGGVAATLAACSDPQTASRARDAATTTAPRVTATTLPLDPDKGWWLQGNFAPVFDEVTETALEVTGSLPHSLTGLYVRNGSNPQSGTSSHWFFGDGMVHGIRLDAGSATWYRNRYVRTPLYTAKHGLLDGGPPGGASTMSNVSLIHHADKLLSLGEVGFSYEINPSDLSTVGPYDFGGKLTTSMTAHPKIHPTTGRMHFFGYGFAPPYLTYYVADADGTVSNSFEVPIDNPTMIHDFQITEHHAIFWVLPVVFDLAYLDSGLPFVWKPEVGAKIGILPLDGPPSAVRWVDLPPCYVFHGINAFEAGDRIVMDVCRLTNAFAPEPATSAIHRWTVDTSGPQLRFSDEVTTELRMDFPMIDRRHTGRPQRRAFFTEILDGGSVTQTGSGLDSIDLGSLISWDYRDGTSSRWDHGGRYAPGEGFFVAEGEGEGEGWLLSLAYDRTTNRSDLVVLDATDLAAGPVATVKLPTRVPHGFHGVWAPDPS